MTRVWDRTELATWILSYGERQGQIYLLRTETISTDQRLRLALFKEVYRTMFRCRPDQSHRDRHTRGDRDHIKTVTKPRSRWELGIGGIKLMGDVNPIGNYASTKGREVGAETRKLAILGRCAVWALEQVAGIERRVHRRGS